LLCLAEGEVVEEVRGVKFAVYPSGDVFGDFGEFVGAVAAAGVFEVDEPDSITVPEEVRQVAVRLAEYGTHIRVAAGVKWSGVEPAQALSNRSGDRGRNIGGKCPRPGTYCRLGLTPIPEAVRQVAGNLTRNGIEKAGQGAGHRFDLFWPHLAAAQRFPWQPGHDHDGRISR
jgi:hypothetical protein